MHHYTAFTSLSEDHDPKHQPIWQVSIPRLAFANPFLLHGIMAIAALHRRSGSPASEQETLLDAARHHQEVALSIYIPLLSDITPENCHPLFAFSQVIAIVSYSLLQVDQEHLTASEYIERLVGIFELLIGASAIAIQGRDWLLEGPLAALLNSDHPLKDQNSIPVWDGSTRALESLAERIAGTASFGRDPYSNFSLDTAKQACRLAIEKLNLLIPRGPEIRSRIDAVTGWPIFAGSDFISMLKHGDNGALVILAYYGVTMHKLTQWWMDGLGKRLVEAVTEVVASEWPPYLMWPRQEVFRETV